MSMIDIHAAALSSKIATYHEFLSRYVKTAKVVYGFVEGKEDPSFYRGFIELLIPPDWRVELWPAGNKDRVYEIHRDIDWRRFPKSRVCFFVDRDLSEVIPEQLAQDKNIYVTTGYSIENDVVCKTVCHRILTELYGFANADHAELDRVCDLFEKELDAFLRYIIPIMAWIVAWRRNGTRPNLNAIRMKDLFAFDTGQVQPNPIRKEKANIATYLHEQCNVVLNPEINIASVEAEFERNDIYRKFTRGKYVLWFLVEFCNSVHKDALSIFKGLTKSPKMHVSLSCANGIAVIGVRCRIPASLQDFIRSTFLSYIQLTNGKKT